MRGNKNSEENISDIARTISYKKLLTLDEKKYKDIFRFNQGIKKLKDIANECVSNFKENILKNYSILISMDKISPFIENEILDSKILEELFNKEFLDYKNFEQNKESISESNQNDKDKLKNVSPQFEQNEKRLEFLKFLVKFQTGNNHYNNIKEILILLNKEQKSPIINQMIDKFKEKELFDNKEEIQFYEYLILEFNSLENNLEYKVKENKDNNFNCDIKLKKEIKDIKYINEFIRAFSKQKNKEVIEEMKTFLFNLFVSTNNLNSLFNKCNDYLNISSQTSNIIDLCKYIINDSEKNYILRIKSLSSLSKKSIFKFTITFNDKKQDLYFYGNTRINEINNYLNNNLEDFKNNEYEYFIIKLKDDKPSKNRISLDEFDSNKTLNELYNEKKLEIIITKENIIKDKLLEKNNNLSKKFSTILINWFKRFSKGNNEMNRAQIAECYNTLTGKKENKFHERSIKIFSFLKLYSSSLDKITLENFKVFFEKSCQDNTKYNDVLANIKNMNSTLDLVEIPQEIDNNKLPRYYLSNEVNEFQNSYLWNSFQNFIELENEDIFDFMSFLSVNKDLYNNVLKNYNYKNYMKLTEKKEEYINNIYILYIIESIIEDVEIINNKENINDNKDNSKEKLTYENIYFQKLESLDDDENKIKKNQFFIDFIKNSYSDLVNYSLFLLNKINGDKEESNNNNITIRSCIICLDIINNIYNSYHNINSKTDKTNLINIKYKALKYIIESNNLSKNIIETSIYEEIIVQIIKCIYKYCNKSNNKNQGEDNGIISALKQNCYTLLFSLLYTNKEMFNIINKKEKNKYLFENILKDLYLIESNKIEFGLLFFSIFKQIEDKISEEFLSYLIDLLFRVFQEYIKSDKKKIENGYISHHLNHLLNYSCKKENLKKKLQSEFEKIFVNYNNFINKKSKEKINGEIAKIIVMEILSKSLDKFNDKSFKNKMLKYCPVS